MTTKLEAANIYEQREFDTWRKTINLRNIHEFEERVGPVRNFDTSASVLKYFQPLNLMRRRKNTQHHMQRGKLKQCSLL